MDRYVGQHREAPRHGHEALDLGCIGACIYCGSTDDLTDEHVIPFGLAGKHQLRKASCRTCMKKTSLWERRVLNDTLGPFRAVLGLPTRHPKRRSTDFTARVRRGDQWTEERIPLDKITATAAFPKLDPPGAYEGREPSTTFWTRGAIAITAIRNDESERHPARRAGVDGILIPIATYPAAFMRMLAKIAWGFTVAQFGHDAVEPEILGIILGTDDHVGHWVGFPLEVGSLFDGPPTSTFRVTVFNNGAGAVFAGIQLFGPQGGPEYQVVVGTLRGDDEGSRLAQLVRLDPSDGACGGAPADSPDPTTKGDPDVTTADVDAWRERMRGLQAVLLDRLPLESDGSASIERLARRAAIKRSLPPSCMVSIDAESAVLRLDLDGRGRFRRGWTAAAMAFAAEVRARRILSMVEPGGDRVWINVADVDTPMHHLESALEHSLELRTDDELAARRVELNVVLDELGWHPMTARTPDGTPDPRIAAVARWIGGPRALTPADLVADAAGSRTILSVPVEVEAIMQTARLLYVRGWDQWEFFTLAHREAVIALESSARAVVLAEDPRSTGLRFAQVVERLGRPSGSPLLSVWERSRVDALRKSRNAMIHPDRGQMLEWISWARAGLFESAALVNLMWARRSHGVPVRVGWDA